MSDEGYKQFRALMSERRKECIRETAVKYSKLPANIRAAIARVAEVENTRLDEMSVKDRAALFKAVKDLRQKIDQAYIILLSAQTLD